MGIESSDCFALCAGGGAPDLVTQSEGPGPDARSGVDDHRLEHALHGVFGSLVGSAGAEAAVRATLSAPVNPTEYRAQHTIISK